MKKSKLEWLKKNLPSGCDHYHETETHVVFYNPENTSYAKKVLKPEWMKVENKK